MKKGSSAPRLKIRIYRRPAQLTSPCSLGLLLAIKSADSEGLFPTGTWLQVKPYISQRNPVFFKVKLHENGCVLYLLTSAWTGVSGSARECCNIDFCQTYGPIVDTRTCCVLLVFSNNCCRSEYRLTLISSNTQRTILIVSISDFSLFPPHVKVCVKLYPGPNVFKGSHSVHQIGRSLRSTGRRSVYALVFRHIAANDSS